ncbi:hypothetical protein [Cellulosimicrobium cellulans]|uniref:hypothetical protein n=1 Tax=Cellulosimicrobium cellulans TaxID=1710 RepID=UPI0020CE33AA|nr:hypothetical protein NMQ07_17245 [Cellulosimicrobium cellulans]
MSSTTPPGSPLTASVLPRARRTRALAPTAALVALALTLGACSGDADDGPTPVAVGPEEYQPILETRVPVPGSAEDEVTLGLVSLTAEGSTVELRVLMTPHFAGDDPTDAHSVYDMFGKDHNPRIVDLGALTQYDVVSGSGKDLATDVVFAETVNGRPLLYQAWFPRPEGEPAAVDVRLHDSWPAFEDVPVTWETEE